ncbi:SDR family NAD(P)-dependent oxidoreductase [Hyalangium minutum]|uniref:Malonyl CoA-acyl carrier protein transacylase n=1 Tax=Hyalangium minutum TaxID=394096 RepID=A0A085WVX3_9BACT|nr:SDR family NAD(P)-dependent oxidoreductase [Hyalangium minutum]KFE71836.1 Malonyl CoA-acyl carrier protein transacylase [Hyalangium minutum]
MSPTIVNPPVMALSSKRLKTTVLFEDYMVRDHLVHGVRILPGVFFLDLTYRMARQQGLEPGQVELRRCLFIEPIAVTESYDKQVRLSVEPQGDHAAISVESRKVKDGVALEEQWTANFTCELHQVPREPRAPLDIARLRATATRRADADELYAFARSVDIDHQEFMKALGTLHYGQGWLLAEVTLSELAQGYLEHFHVHPAYLDFSTLMPFCLFEKDAAERQPFIPIFIDAFRAHGPLSRTCVAYVEQTGQQSLSGDTVHSDIRLFSPEGELLVHFRNFRAKKIRTRNLITQHQAPSQAPEPARPALTPVAPPAAPRPSASASPLERVQAELRSLVSRALKRLPEDVDVNAGFYEQGLASVDLLQIVRALEARLGRELYPTLLFEYTTVSALAGYLVEQFGDLLARPSESAPAEPPPPPPQAAAAAAPAATSPAVESSKPAPRAPAAREEADEDEIAIVGVAGRYPQARDLDEFWANLKAGRDCITEIPRSRWEVERYFDSERGKPGRTYSRWGGFIDGVDEFDPLFFNISPREAEMMDPQERVFLETAWAALEDAGYTRERLGTGKGNDIGVFAGVMWSDYQLFGLEEILKGNPVVAGSWFSSVANRISYFLNLQGPSVPVDTACSSSLYAIHLACESIKRGECSAALVGGVNASLHFSKYLKLSELQMLSTDGRCRTFGKGGNGYVPGEGVGAVLLKPLKRAIADRDTIHAVIKSTAVNHGGRTSGFSVPSPDAQARLIRDALEKARIPASTVSYIEAHGTGTSLGDPIEIAGLTSAFRGDSTEKGFCAVGSVKSNIGHLEAAAGIAGLTKVLLCMRHRTLVPSLHSRELNPSIPFADTPFYVPQEARAWEKRTGHPRRAGISSFGAGGSNAHILLEEYEDPRVGREAASALPQLVVLSARTPERLQESARKLRDFLEAHGEARLEDLAYTLQVGRETMEARLAVVAQDKAELRKALEGYLDGTPEGARRVLSGQVKRGASGAGSESEDHAYHQSLWQGGKLARLAALWTEGTEITWSRLEHSPTLRRIPLPTYPFARRRCWIPQVASSRGAGASAAPVLHPLIDANTSTLKGPRFLKRLTATEFYVADHIVREQRLLPGVVSLEMARAAGALASETGISHLRNVLWASPLVVDSPRDVTVRLSAGGAHVEFEVVTGSGEEATVHALGKLYSSSGEAQQPPAPVSIDEIQRRCAQVLSDEAVYSGFVARGFRYGPGLRAIHELRTGPGEALAELRLPEHLQAEASAYVLHPALLDGALQAVSGLTPPASGGEGELLPFSVGELRLHSPIPSRCFVHVTVGEPKESTGTPTRFHLRLLDEAGRTLVSLRDFTLRRVAREELPVQRPVENPEGLLIYEPHWEETPVPAPYIPSGGDAQRPFLVFEREEAHSQGLRRQLRERSGEAPIIRVQPGEGFRCLSPEHYQITPAREEDYRQLWEALRERGLQPAALFHLWNHEARPLAFDTASSAETVSTELQEQLRLGLQSLFLLARTLPGLRLRERLPVIYAFQGEGEQPQHSAVAGFARSVALENPKLRVRVVRFAPRQAEVPADWDALLRELQPPEQTEVRIGSAGRQVRRFAPVAPPASGTSARPGLLRPRGVYLLTGGAGGLGLVFARYLAREAQARVALLGRSPLDAARRASLSELEAMGAEVLYLSADVADPAALQTAVTRVRERFGALHGIIHAAGVIEDAMAVNKPLNSFQRVLTPKIQGTLNLDAATREVPLDFLVLFSSASAVFGSMGQTDYAAGNQFMDAFATLREELRERGLRSGRTLSLNWPLWREGGMRIQPEVEEMILRNTGLKVLETGRGLTAFSLAQALPGSQLMLLEGDPAVIHKRIELATQPVVRPQRSAPPPPAAPEPAVAERAVAPPTLETLQSHLEQDLSETCSALLKVSTSELDAEADFSDYGVDSLMIMRILDHLEERYTVSLDPSALTEHPSIRSLAKHLVAEHRGHVEARLATPAQAPEPVQPLAAPASPPPPPPASPSLLGRETPSHTPTASVPAQEVRAAAPTLLRPSDPPRRVAVIGVACRFPGSHGPESFWANLAAGRDLVTTVPTERWDAERYYDPRKAVPNKSYSKWGAFAEEVDLFDAAFFGIAEEDADWMDPQQRIALETAQELLDGAGYPRKELAHSRTGVFLGATANDYVRSGFRGHGRSTPHLLLNTLQNMVAARISHFWDLKGPSLVVDTACSSSLLAIHHACRGILSGEIDMAIAGGMYLLLDPFLHVSFSQAQLLSEDGRTRIFDRKASGFTPGEGVGMVLLKEYGQAVRDGDRILATVLGSAVNNDGRTLGLTMPSKEAQVEVIGEALRLSGVSARDIGYLETHGSGNAFGDPLEIHAASEVFRRESSRKQYCGVGSVKSNIGALLQAGAVASFIKVVLALQHQELPATVHCEEPHPRFHFPETPFFPVTQLQPWEPLGGTRYAAVSSFGLGGTNCHLVLGQGDALHPGYRPTRQPLAPTRFQRKRHWMPWTEAQEPRNTQPPSLEQLLDALDQGAIAVEQAVNVITGGARP